MLCRYSQNSHLLSASPRPAHDYYKGETSTSYAGDPQGSVVGSKERLLEILFVI
uniref:Uncharacterized protein n=1 Tax=Hyaloperonospora arabidopsidis (strain Emoy2) TaxID=559515 RepID=M4BFD2_HYAAE